MTARPVGSETLHAETPHVKGRAEFAEFGTGARL